MVETLRILWFNWRCVKHPEAGGAEVYTFEIAKRLVKMGHEVTIITSRPNGLSPHEIIDGIEVIRDGGTYTVYIKARKIYEEKFRGKVDIVIDEINSVPFFTIRYVKEPVVALIHQLMREYWLLGIKPPISWIGYLLEPKVLRMYRKVPTITVSESTKKDLEKLGFEKVHIVPNGLNISPLDRIPEKEKIPTIIYLGRLKKTKRPDHAVSAFKHVVEEVSDARLWIVGDGPYREKLQNLVKKMHLLDKVVFFGRVTEEVKYELLKKAWILVVPSVREGFGLVVLEANAMATPVIGYNVPGLKDSVKHMETGILVESGNIEALAKTTTQLLTDINLRNRLAKNALKHAQQYNWNRSTEYFIKVIKGITHE